MMALWNSLACGLAAADKTLFLDYFEPLPPVSIICAIKNGDSGVAAITTISQLWAVIIAISAFLISFTPMDSYPTMVPVDLTTRFKNYYTALEHADIWEGSTSYQNMLGRREGILEFPDGTTEKYSYQTFSGRNVIPNAELHVTVDGFFASLICEEASYHIYLAESLGEIFKSPYLNFTMASSNCDVTSGWLGPEYVNEQKQYYARLGTGSCHNSSEADDQRILVTLGSLAYRASSSGQFLDVVDTTSANLICRPTYLASKLDAVKIGTHVLSLTPSSSPGSGTLGDIHAWHIAQALMDSTISLLTIGGWTTYHGNQVKLLRSSIVFNASDTVVTVDPYMDLVLSPLSKSPPSAVSLQNASMLQDLVSSYYQTYAAFIAKEFLTETVSTPATGQALLYRAFLVINDTAAHSIAAILALAAFLFGVAILTMPNATTITCAPSSIAGMAKLTSRSDTVISRFKGLGRSSMKIIPNNLSGSSYMTRAQDGDVYHLRQTEIIETKSPDGILSETYTGLQPINPTVLRLWFRVGVSFILLGIIGGLEATLRISQHDQGIGVVPVDVSYLHYSWTTVPAIVFTIISLVCGSTDRSIRTLAPYVNLRRGSAYRRSLGLGLLDLSIPRVLLKEMRTKSFAALFGTLAPLIASLLTTFSASLFELKNVPSTSRVQLQTYSSLSNVYRGCGECDSLDKLNAHLILQSNLSYPKFTHENLVFPELSLDSDIPLKQDIVLDVTLPAVRLNMDCRLYDESSNVAEVDESKDLYINITAQEFCAPFPSTYEYNTYLSPVGEGVNARAWTVKCYENFHAATGYFWADIKLDPDPVVSSVSVLMCNESLEVVDVFTRFIDAEFTIDPSHAPVPDEATASNTTAFLDWSSNDWPYDAQAQVYPNATLDGFFSKLTSSQYAIPLEYLKNTAKSGMVRDAVIFQNGIFWAQILHYTHRAPPETTDAFSRGVNENDAVAYHANMIETPGKIHLVQDEATTRILQAMLAAILLCSLASWALMPDTKILPFPPTSIAAVIALLADGNIFELLPADSQFMDEDELERSLDSYTFKLGSMDAEEENGGDGAEDNEAKFVIYGVPNSLESPRNSQPVGGVGQRSTVRDIMNWV